MITLIILFLFYQNAFSRNVSVVTKLGDIIGSWSNDELYSQYLGVPYALVDESNPFGPSTPHPGFSSPYEAHTEVVCPQTTAGIAIGTIQCLTLNIYVPNSEPIDKKPVMVWIHGGAFVEGSGNSNLYGPKYLVRHDVVVISMNYRLGVYGFMCTDSAKSPGNNGLKDQLLALRWINENIEAFGGDRDKITVFGESAGGMSIHLHIVSKYEELFQRAIIQSGPAVSPWTIMTQNNTIPIILARELGFATEDLDAALDYLAKADVFELVRKATELEIGTAENNIQPLTKPCVENGTLNVERFVEIHPDLAKARTNIDVIAGYTSQEMIFQFGNEPDEFFDNYPFNEFIEAGLPDFEQDDIIRQFYTGDEDLNRSLEAEITNFGSDFVFNHPTEKMIDLFVKDGIKKVYKYVFSYEGGRNLFKLVQLNAASRIEGASHADELGYQFDIIVFPATPSFEDQIVIDRMSLLWTNFAKYGDPTPETSELLPSKWEPVNMTHRPCLNIDNQLTLESRIFNDRMAFWDLIYYGK